jgi:hypothetical protein
MTDAEIYAWEFAFIVLITAKSMVDKKGKEINRLKNRIEKLEEERTEEG